MKHIALTFLILLATVSYANASGISANKGSSITITGSRMSGEFDVTSFTFDVTSFTIASDSEFTDTHFVIHTNDKFSFISCVIHGDKSYLTVDGKDYKTSDDIYEELVKLSKADPHRFVQTLWFFNDSMAMFSDGAVNGKRFYYQHR